MPTASPLFEGADWTLSSLDKIHEAVTHVGVDELGLELYRNRIEIITSEQMLDAYASIGLPHMYSHWSFGKRFAQQEMLYRKGVVGLALEMIVNSDPSVCYLMEENSASAQATVLAHAAMGHNHFFRNNRVFREWTDAKAILDYAQFARDYVARCEERFGPDEVERTLDAAHALQDQGVDRTAWHRRHSVAHERERIAARRRHERESESEFWRAVSSSPKAEGEPVDVDRQAEVRSLALPEENILYFIEKHSPGLKDWQRELVRIVRSLSAYFEPQRQTKMMNEGCACWCHFTIMHRLREKGLLTEGAMLEFLHLHSQVVAQPDYDDQRFSSINPYALGFAMTRDIERICTEPTDEDREWFPDIAGNGLPLETLKRAWSDFRDESFVRQFLSPRVMRQFHLFRLDDDPADDHYRVGAIHDDRGYRRVRSALADEYDPGETRPRIEVTDADLRGSRQLRLEHRVRAGRTLDALEARRTLRHAARLWGYPVVLKEIDEHDDSVLATYSETAS
ncbi:MAG: SpoVR family protein [Halofilum sp. (in: g-proteobacteria)]